MRQRMLVYLPPLPTFLQTFFRILTSEKRTKLPELGSGGGVGDSGNARKKTFFFIDVFPNKVIGYGDSAKNTQGCYPENITILLTNDIKIVKNLKTV